MALEILSAPAMSAEAEGVFSHGRRVIPCSRASLSARIIEQTLCLKHWLRHDLVTEAIETGSDDEVLQ